MCIYVSQVNGAKKALQHFFFFFEGIRRIFFQGKSICLLGHQKVITFRLPNGQQWAWSWLSITPEPLLQQPCMLVFVSCPRPQQTVLQNPRFVAVAVVRGQ